MDNSSSSPQVTVLMTVFNGEKYLAKAVESILDQTYRDFEFLIIDDGSTDHTREILESYKDPRIKVIHNQLNMGIPISSNIGIALSQNGYIARMDADDVSLPKRLEAQVAFLEANPEIGLLGTAVQDIDSEGRIIAKPRIDMYESYMIQFGLAFECPLEHSSVIFRKKVVEEVGGYSSELGLGEDHHLYLRLIGSTQFANLRQVLLFHRENESSITHTQSGLSFTSHVHLIKNEIERVTQNQYPFEVYEGLSTKKWITPKLARQIINCLLDLYFSYCQNEGMDEQQTRTLRYMLTYRINRILLRTKPKFPVADLYARNYFYNRSLLLRQVKVVFSTGRH